METKRGVPVTRALLAVPAKHSARRDRGSAGLPGLPGASPRPPLSSRTCAARAGTGEAQACRVYCCLNSAPRLPDPGSPLRCVREDEKRVGDIQMISAQTPCPRQKPFRKSSLIPRKRAALSRRMGGRFSAVWPILRDGPNGPPQDEGLGAEARQCPRPIQSTRPQPSTVITGLIGDDIRKSRRPGLEPGPKHHLSSKAPGSGPGQRADNRAVRLPGQAPDRKREVRR